MDFTNGVPFDPGYSAHTSYFSENLDYCSQILASIKQFNQKKNQFRILRPKLAKLFENCTAFYLGCLLWAAYIKFSFEESPKEILNNAFFGKKVPDEDIFYEIDSLLTYFDKYPKDCAYFFGKPESFPQAWFEILKIYREFLVVNENFEKVRTTADLKLPKSIKTPTKTELEQILARIESVTKSGKLEDLFEIKGLIL